MGKTRLAVQSAADLIPRFDDGAWLVELAPIGDPSLVPEGSPPHSGSTNGATSP